MNICVCVKQVPDTTEIRIDPVTSTLIRSGVPSIVNPYDTYALENAARLKDRYPDSRITVISMGPPQAKNALKECLSIAADQAYLVTGREFGGSDTYATSYILSRAIRYVEEKEGRFDCIFCGKQAIDGDTAQVGPEIAEHMDCPQITYGVEARVEGDQVLVKRETGEGYEIRAAAMPCVITVTKPSFNPRFPTIKSKMAASRAVIPTLTVEDLTVDRTRIGLKGSPTKVKKSFTPPRKQGGVTIAEETCEASAKKLFELLGSANVI